jgi:transposase-like protein
MKCKICNSEMECVENGGISYSEYFRYVCTECDYDIIVYENGEMEVNLYR